MIGTYLVNLFILRYGQVSHILGFRNVFFQSSSLQDAVEPLEGFCKTTVLEAMSEINRTSDGFAHLQGFGYFLGSYEPLGRLSC
jgi:hypothetical protein